jgi:pyruvate/2-oxoglutarate dehydrogenase complex dihydrolipoamide acyltransferase (E2) component
VLVVAALLLIVGAVLSWFVERPTPAPPPPAPAGSAVPPAAPAEPPAPPMPGPPAPAAEAPERPREIVGYRDVRVPGRPLSECMGPDREIGPEVLRCRDGYTKREPIYR